MQLYKINGKLNDGYIIAHKDGKTKVFAVFMGMDDEQAVNSLPDGWEVLSISRKSEIRKNKAIKVAKMISVFIYIIAAAAVLFPLLRLLKIILK